ncbi:MAG: hypothetical protein Kow0098_05990 [Ignavibacteriaceae bacterium]
MKIFKSWFFLALLFIIPAVLFQSGLFTAQNQTNRFTILIHGGAGTIDKNLPDSIKKDYLTALENILRAGRKMLENGEKAIDVVEAVVRLFEDDSLFNAGKGAVLNSEGHYELDACIMDGTDLSNGAVTGVMHIKNPVSLARLIMDSTSNIFFSGTGAEKLAEKYGVEMVGQDYFYTERRFNQWKKIDQRKKEIKGTAGCVVLDIYGNLAAATSTGGLSYKMPGRIGDTPVSGAGTYANNLTCAVSCTGTGELFMKYNIAFRVSALMEYKNYSLKQAADEVIFSLLKPDDGGLIAVDKHGNFAAPFNTKGMFRGVANSDGLFEIKIWE